MNGTETPELWTIDHGIPDDAGARVPDVAVRRPALLTSRQASALLDRRASITTALVVVAVTGVAWWSTARSARDMSSMAQGLAQLGTAMPFHMHPLVFLRMWTAMMAAMMLPTIAPTVTGHQGVNCRRGTKRVAPTVAFGSG